MRQSRREFLKVGAIGALSAAVVDAGGKAAIGGRKPNVLFIMTDQHNARCLGCYGHPVVRTPNMDRIARDGVLFEHAFCQTGQCVPSRYSIWTGRYSRSTGTYSNGNGQNPDEDTVADIFGRAGYVCGTIGKHHMIMNDENRRHGFHHVFTGDGNRRYAQQGDFLPYDESHPGRSNCGASAIPNDQHPAGVITRDALRFLRENRDRPFLLWYSFHGPHSPVCPSRPWAEQYDAERLRLPPNHRYAYDLKNPIMEKALQKSGAFTKPEYHRKTLAYYLGYVSQIDHNIGRVLDELDRLGLTRDTLVVYTADHGEFAGEHGCWTKTMCGYDATVRVPMMIRFPGRIPSGQRRAQLAQSIDLLPTLLDYTGFAIPGNVDGRSLRPIIENKDTRWRDFAISEIGGDPERACIMLRTRTRKYVRFRGASGIVHEQLFDLEKDPWETSNRIADPDYARDLENLKARLARWESKHPPATPVPGRPKAKAARPRRRASSSAGQPKRRSRRP